MCFPEEVLLMKLQLQILLYVLSNHRYGHPLIHLLLSKEYFLHNKLGYFLQEFRQKLYRILYQEL